MADITRWIVILVDDEPDTLNLIHEILVYQGAQVYKASNGEECLSLLDRVTPTVILMDLAMPEMDGWQLLAQARALPGLSDVPVVAMTAYYSDRVGDEADRAGFDAFLPKPIKANELLLRLTELLG
ncbi:MAG: response regulator [Chloroflexi bacterium]|nr:response regulator [Chloroflexota bacterium]